MKPKHVARARRFIGKRWFWRLRACQNRKMYRWWDDILIVCQRKEISKCCRELQRYARKEAYYTNKLNADTDGK